MMDDKTQVGALGVGIDGSDKWTVGERRVVFCFARRAVKKCPAARSPQMHSEEGPKDDVERLVGEELELDGARDDMVDRRIRREQ